MVDSIKGPGGKTIIVTKPPAKDKGEKSKGADFDQTLRRKDGAEAPAVPTQLRSVADNNLQVIQQQQLARMQRLEEISRQIQNGTYKMVDPTVLAERLLQILLDKKLKSKFIKKFLDEEKDTAKAKGKPLSDLELKKLVFLAKNAPDEAFEDADLEELLKELT